VYVLGITVLKPAWAPALPLEARTFREPNGSSGTPSLIVLVVIAAGAAVGFAHWYYPQPDPPMDELLVLSTAVGVGVAFVASVINHVTKLGLLSRMAERVTFVLIPPLALIFLVLGTIFLGVATPTEGGAMGASGALAMALARRRLSLNLLRQAMNTTAKLTSFVVFILVGARVFSLTFYGVDGHIWVEHLLSGLPGGQLGFLIVVNLLVFVLAFFLDFFELAFIIIPLLGPVAEKLGIDLIWFGILISVNMQTSFMHPPFGYALFYLRSVAPVKDYVDRITRKTTKGVTTAQIYWGAVPFVVIQLIMVGLIIAFPNLVSGGLAKKAAVNTDQIRIEVPVEQPEETAPLEGEGQHGAAPDSQDPKADEDDAAKALERALKDNKK
jgi:TRAP-type mannitol/chloroaromatic compound transport system permease large subunit